jgi:hypothetical protein
MILSRPAGAGQLFVAELRAEDESAPRVLAIMATDATTSSDRTPELSGGETIRVLLAGLPASSLHFFTGEVALTCDGELDQQALTTIAERLARLDAALPRRPDVRAAAAHARQKLRR